jgi:hypothetical protein
VQVNYSRIINNNIDDFRTKQSNAINEEKEDNYNSNDDDNSKEHTVLSINDMTLIDKEVENNKRLNL